MATLIAVGDTSPYIEPAESIFDNVTDFLASADWRFAQVERTFSARGTFREDSQSPNSRVAPHLASAYRYSRLRRGQPGQQPQRRLGHRRLP